MGDLDLGPGLDLVGLFAGPVGDEENWEGGTGIKIMFCGGFDGISSRASVSITSSMPGPLHKIVES